MPNRPRRQHRSARDTSSSAFCRFSPTAPEVQVDAAEVHFKKALLTQQFGLNRN